MSKRHDLKKAWSVVQYEWDVLHYTANRLMKRQTSPMTKYEVRVYTESFLVHFRNLVDFLSPRTNARDDDIKAVDFATGFVSTLAPVQYREEIDKRLSHLSYRRIYVTTDERSWHYLDMLAELEAAWVEFRDQIKD